MATVKKEAAGKAAETTPEPLEGDVQPNTQEDTENGSEVDSGGEITGEQADEANDAPAATAEEQSEGGVAVVVLSGRTVKHDGEKISAGRKVTLPKDEAARLKKLGFVAYFSDVRAAALAAEGVAVSVSDGVSVVPGE